MNQERTITNSAVPLSSTVVKLLLALCYAFFIVRLTALIQPFSAKTQHVTADTTCW